MYRYVAGRMTILLLLLAGCTGEPVRRIISVCPINYWPYGGCRRPTGRAEQLDPGACVHLVRARMYFPSATTWVCEDRLYVQRDAEMPTHGAASISQLSDHLRLPGKLYCLLGELERTCVERFNAAGTPGSVDPSKVRMEQRRNEGAGGNGRSPIKPADQRHSPARFPLTRPGIEPGSQWCEVSEAAKRYLALRVTCCGLTRQRAAGIGERDQTKHSGGCSSELGSAHCNGVLSARVTNQFSGDNFTCDSSVRSDRTGGRENLHADWLCESEREVIHIACLQLRHPNLSILKAHFGQRICRPYSDRVNVTSLDAEFRTRPIVDTAFTRTCNVNYIRCFCGGIWGFGVLLQLWATARHSAATMYSHQLSDERRAKGCARQETSLYLRRRDPETFLYTFDIVTCYLAHLPRGHATVARLLQGRSPREIISRPAVVPLQNFPRLVSRELHGDTLQQLLPAASNDRAVSTCTLYAASMQKEPANRFKSPAGSLRIFLSGNPAGRCRWSAAFLRGLPFPPPLRSGSAPYSPDFTLIGSQEIAVEQPISLHSLCFGPSSPPILYPSAVRDTNIIIIDPLTLVMPSFILLRLGSSMHLDWQLKFLATRSRHFKSTSLAETPTYHLLHLKGQALCNFKQLMLYSDADISSTVYTLNTAEASSRGKQSTPLPSVRPRSANTQLTSREHTPGASTKLDSWRPCMTYRKEHAVTRAPLATITVTTHTMSKSFSSSAQLAVLTRRTQQEPVTRVEPGETECIAATHERAARHPLRTSCDISNRQFRRFETNFISISSPALNSNGATVFCVDIRSDLGSSFEPRWRNRALVIFYLMTMNRQQNYTLKQLPQLVGRMRVSLRDAKAFYVAPFSGAGMTWQEGGDRSEIRAWPPLDPTPPLYLSALPQGKAAAISPIGGSHLGCPNTAAWAARHWRRGGNENRYSGPTRASTATFHPDYFRGVSFHFCRRRLNLGGSLSARPRPVFAQPGAAVVKLLIAGPPAPRPGDFARSCSLQTLLKACLKFYLQSDEYFANSFGGEVDFKHLFFSPAVLIGRQFFRHAPCCRAQQCERVLNSPVQRPRLITATNQHMIMSRVHRELSILACCQLNPRNTRGSTYGIAWYRGNLRRSRHDGNTARLACRSDEALGVRASVARIAPSLLDLEHPTLHTCAYSLCLSRPSNPLLNLLRVAVVPHLLNVSLGTAVCVKSRMKVTLHIPTISVLSAVAFSSNKAGKKNSLYLFLFLIKPVVALEARVSKVAAMRNRAACFTCQIKSGVTTVIVIVAVHTVHRVMASVVRALISYCGSEPIVVIGSVSEVSCGKPSSFVNVTAKLACSHDPRTGMNPISCFKSRAWCIGAGDSRPPSWYVTRLPFYPESSRITARWSQGHGASEPETPGRHLGTSPDCHFTLRVVGLRRCGVKGMVHRSRRLPAAILGASQAGRRPTSTRHTAVSRCILVVIEQSSVGGVAPSRGMIHRRIAFAKMFVLFIRRKKWKEKSFARDKRRRYSCILAVAHASGPCTERSADVYTYSANFCAFIYEEITTSSVVNERTEQKCHLHLSVPRYCSLGSAIPPSPVTVENGMQTPRLRTYSLDSESTIPDQLQIGNVDLTKQTPTKRLMELSIIYL
ncbi:hypothetical protein PR048_006968 [Dryococelus australis]|uniref:Uncharacterized protein n=1 Tax=Dryococelus australis TaxID=614101 RepID=A0ABQ9ICD3_9NEOP|nr:hypothetical protein PR048_006968 [Dryococelus australis]